MRKAFNNIYPEKYVAVKTIIKDRMKGNLEPLNIEAIHLKTADHPFIVKFHEKFEDSTYFHIKMELCEKGQVLQNLDSEGK